MIMNDSKLKVQLGVMLPKDLVKRIKIICVKHNKTQREIFLEAIKYLTEKYE